MEEQADILIEYGLNLKVRFPDKSPFQRMLIARRELCSSLRQAALIIHSKREELIEYLKKEKENE